MGRVELVSNGLAGAPVAAAQSAWIARPQDFSRELGPQRLRQEVDVSNVPSHGKRDPKLNAATG